MKTTHGKGRTGPGGIKCPCCTKGKPSDVKRATARHARHHARKIIRLWEDGWSPAFIRLLAETGKAE